MGNWYGTFLDLPRNPNFDEIIEGIDSLRKTIDQINDRVGLDMSTLDTSIKGNELGFFQIGWKAQAKGGTWPAPKDKPAPAAPDTVPVVRCGECMHRGNPDVCPWSHKELRQYAEGTRWVITDGTVFDGFCHLGAKGDEGA